MAPSDWDDLKFYVETIKETLELRTESASDRASWMDAVRLHKAFYVAARPARQLEDARLPLAAASASAAVRARLPALGASAEALAFVQAQLSTVAEAYVASLASERARRSALRARVRALQGDKAQLEAAVVLAQAARTQGDEEGAHAAAAAGGVVGERRDSSDNAAQARAQARRTPSGGGTPVLAHHGDSSGDDEEPESYDARSSLLLGTAPLSDEEEEEEDGRPGGEGKDVFFDCAADSDAISSLALAQPPAAAPPPPPPPPAAFLPPWGAAALPCPPRRALLPCPLEKDVRASLWAVVKEAVGKDLTRVTLPIAFNEPLSALQKFAEELEFSELLDLAALQPKGSRERLLLVAAFAVSGYASAAGRVLKPFNPLERETFELVRPDKGFRFLSEKVRHHPLHLAAHAQGRGWTFWGETSIKTKFWGRCIQLLPSGDLNACFADGDAYSWKKVPTTISNIILGPLSIDYSGVTRVACRSTGQALRLRFKEAGLLFDSGADAREVSGSWESGGGPEVHGSWDAGLSVTDRPGMPPRALWRRGFASAPPPGGRYNFTPFAIALNELPAGADAKALPPTDSRLRPDQRMLEDGRYSEANGVKMRLEEAQRAVRKRLAEQGQSTPAPRWFKASPLEEVLGAGGRAPDGATQRASDNAAGEAAGESGFVFAYSGGYWEARERGDWGADAASIFSVAAQAGK